MLARRETLRKAKDFGAADALRDELFERGVRVDDERREWRCTASGRVGTFEAYRRGRGGGPPDDRGSRDQRRYDDPRPGGARPRRPYYD